MKLTYLFLFTFSILFLGFFAANILQSPTGGVISSTVYSDYVSFTAQPDYGLPIGSGSQSLSLPAPVTSCTFSGQWVTQNDLFQRRDYCHQATGTFSGTADVSTQSVLNDPDLFKWAGLSQAALNPPAEQHDGYSFWMELCDDDRYSSTHIPRSFVTGTLSGFGTKTLSLDWHYFDDSNARPQVLFMIDLTCKLSS